MPSESKRVVLAAFIGDLAIAAGKFTAAVVTGSSAMLSEAIHSTVDTGNEVLLWLGMRRSHHPPDEQHPFGYGKELYFWTLMVAMLIFGLGGGMSFYEGLTRLRHPQPLEDPTWSYAVLAFSALFEGATWAISMRELLRRKPEGVSLWRMIRGTKDTTVVTVLMEDSAALAGLLIAFLGIFLSHRLHMPALDAAASIAIGVLLAAVAVFLTVESKNLLVGESARKSVRDDIRRIAESDPGVQRVGRVMTMQLAPDAVLLNLDVEFCDQQTVDDLERTVDRMEKAIREKHPEVSRIFIEAESLTNVSKGAKSEGGELSRTA